MRKGMSEGETFAVVYARSGRTREAGGAVDQRTKSGPPRRRDRRRVAVAIAAAAATAICVLPAHPTAAQTVYYTNPGGGDWNTTFVFTYFGWRFDASGGFGFA